MKTNVQSRLIAVVLFLVLSSLFLGTAIFCPAWTQSLGRTTAGGTEEPRESSRTFNSTLSILDDWTIHAKPSAVQKPKQKPNFGTICPPPTVRSDSEDPWGPCTLGGQNVVLVKTLRLPSNTALDCEGRTISPQSDGLGATRSVPEVGILLDGARNVVITNCNIKGFNFGIFAVNSKAGVSYDNETLHPTNIGGRTTKQNKVTPLFSPILPIRIVHNTIDAYFTGISLISVDNTEISETNTIIFPVDGGRGLVVERNSDCNIIQGNIFEARDAKATNPVRVPGPSVTGPPDSNGKKDPMLSTNPVLTSAGSAILCAQVGGDEPTFLNAIIEGQVYPLTTTANPVPDKDFSQNNKFLGNIMTFSRPASDGISLAAPQKTEVGGNIISTAQFGIRVGSQSGPIPGPTPGFTRTFPSQCTLDSKALCFQKSDCQILGKDNGDCGSPLKEQVFWPSDGSNVHDNKIENPSLGGIVVAGRNTNVTSNTITGPVVSSIPPPGSASPGAITLLGGYALDSSIVTRNIVQNAAIALSLTSVFQNLGPSCPNRLASCLASGSCLGAQIFLNDFFVAGNPIAVQTDDAYNFSSDLSWGGQGNYWEQPCFDPNQVRFFTTSKGVNTTVVDCNSYEMPVAKSSPGLPKPCLP